jgi:hypothetical protein
VTDGLAGRTATRIRAVVAYMRRRGMGAAYLRQMIAPPGGGRTDLTDDVRREALRYDSTLRRFGVRCLWRSAVIVDRLRHEGYAARVGISVSEVDPKLAHAECEIGDEPLRPYGSGSVRLR